MSLLRTTPGVSSPSTTPQTQSFNYGDDSKQSREVFGELTNTTKYMGSVSQRSERRIGCTKNHAGVRKRNATPVKTAQNTWRDIDSMHSDDPLMCSEYVDDIYTNLQKSEVVLYPLSDYIEKVQTDISSTMRGILVDWLVEVAEEYKLSDDTLFLSVLYLDRCLSIRTVARSRLQLLGITCMLVASKYEEIYAPQVDEFCYITDNTYTREDVLSMERIVLDSLNFDLTHPTTKTFLRRCLSAAESDVKVDFLAGFLSELALLEYTFLRYSQSTIAAASVSLALMTLGRSPWSKTLEHYTHMFPCDLRECVQALHTCHLAAQQSSLSAVREKYSQMKFKCVSLIKPVDSCAEYSA